MDKICLGIFPQLCMTKMFIPSKKVLGHVVSLKGEENTFFPTARFSCSKQRNFQGS